jgi:hypothetical protein
MVHRSLARDSARRYREFARQDTAASIYWRNFEARVAKPGLMHYKYPA